MGKAKCLAMTQVLEASEYGCAGPLCMGVFFCG